MKKSIKKSVLKAVGKIVEYQANVTNSGWPPTCVGLIHQPKRFRKK